MLHATRTSNVFFLVALLGLVPLTVGCNKHIIIVDPPAPASAANVDDAELPADSTNAPDACEGIPATGECTSPSELSVCVTPTGQGTPKLIKQQCAAHETCAIDAKKGRPSCIPLPGRCNPGAEECTGANTKHSCDPTGTWVDLPCAGCTTKDVSVTCPATVTTVMHHGSVQYEVKGPNQDFTDWDPQSAVIAPIGALIISSVVDPQGDFITIDATSTDINGEYDVKIAATPGAADEIDVFAVRATPAGIEYAVASPNIPDGEWDVGNIIPTDSNNNAGFWGWGQLVQGLANNSTLSITEDQGSGAMRIFDYLRFAHDTTTAITGSSDDRLMVWMRLNSSFSCGACFFELPNTFGGYAFDSQIVRGANATDEDFWADSVTVHEFGHWVMAAYGVPSNEGGPHILGCLTMPGQAWSEGWATGFSSLAREDSVYADKQQGSFFWFDVAQHQYSDGGAWQEPQRNGSLLQMTDENSVASILWNLGAHSTDGDSITPNSALFNALKSPRMKGASFARGYTTHRWDVPNQDCTKTNVADTHEAAPMIADFLDALSCAGFDKTRIANAIGTYPYPVNAPLCQ